MSDRLELGESKESASSLHGVDATKDTGQELGRVRIFLERHELAIEHVEILVRLDQKLRNDLVLLVVAHRRLSKGAHL